MGHCKVKCSLCSEQQVGWGLKWGLQQSWAGGITRQPQCTEPCQFVSGQPWAHHGALQDQKEPLQQATGVVDTARTVCFGSRAGQVVCGVRLLPVCGDFQRRRQLLATTAPRALPVCEGPARACHWALQGQMQPLMCAAGVVVPALGVAAELGLRFCRFVEISRGGGSTRHPQHTEPC